MGSINISPSEKYEIARKNIDTRQLKICHIASAFWPGGVYQSVRQLTKFQALDQHNVYVIYDVLRGIPSDIRSDFHPDVGLVPWRATRKIQLIADVKSFWSLLRYLHKLRPDVLHLHSSKAGALGRMAGRVLNIPSLYSPRAISLFRTDITPFAKSTYKFIEIAMSHLGGTMIGCSTDEYRLGQQLFSRSGLIPNGIDLGEFDRITNNDFSQNTVPVDDQKPFTLAIFGRITPKNNPRTISQIADNSSPKWRWMWVGDVDLEGGREHLSSRIDVLGWNDREEALRHLRQADVILHLSRWEGMSLALIEGMALRKCIVASDSVGNRDLVQDGQTGFLINDDAEVLPVLKRLENSKSLREEIGERARKFVENNHSSETLAEKWINAYLQEISFHQSKS